MKEAIITGFCNALFLVLAGVVLYVFALTLPAPRVLTPVPYVDIHVVRTDLAKALQMDQGSVITRYAQMDGTPGYQIVVTKATVIVSLLYDRGPGSLKVGPCCC